MIAVVKPVVRWSLLEMLYAVSTSLCIEAKRLNDAMPKRGLLLNIDVKTSSITHKTACVDGETTT